METNKQICFCCKQEKECTQVDDRFVCEKCNHLQIRESLKETKLLNEEEIFEIEVKDEEDNT